MSQKGVLVFQVSHPLTQEMADSLLAYVRPAAERAGFEALVCDSNSDVRVHNDIADLTAAIHQQTAAINRLANSNAALVQAMAEAEGMDEEDQAPYTYLDGAPCR